MTDLLSLMASSYQPSTILTGPLSARSRSKSGKKGIKEGNSLRDIISNPEVLGLLDSVDKDRFQALSGRDKSRAFLARVVQNSLNGQGKNLEQNMINQGVNKTPQKLIKLKKKSSPSKVLSGNHSETKLRGNLLGMSTESFNPIHFTYFQPPQVGPKLQSTSRERQAGIMLADVEFNPDTKKFKVHDVISANEACKMEPNRITYNYQRRLQESRKIKLPHNFQIQNTTLEISKQQAPQVSSRNLKITRALPLAQSTTSLSTLPTQRTPGRTETARRIKQEEVQISQDMRNLVNNSVQLNQLCYYITFKQTLFSSIILKKDVNYQAPPDFKMVKTIFIQLFKIMLRVVALRVDLMRGKDCSAHVAQSTYQVRSGSYKIRSSIFICQSDRMQDPVSFVQQRSASRNKEASHQSRPKIQISVSQSVQDFKNALNSTRLQNTLDSSDIIHGGPQSARADHMLNQTLGQSARGAANNSLHYYVSSTTPLHNRRFSAYK